MSSEWLTTTIGELAGSGEATIQTGPFGSQLHKHDYVETGTPVIPTEAIGRGRILDMDVPQVSADKAAELARHRLHVDDILFARRGAQATGLSAIVDKRYDGSLCGTGALLLRVCSPRVLPHYLSLYLSSEFAFNWLRTHAVGAVMPNLNTEIIKALPLVLPPLAEQKELSLILGSLDDRITLLRETNATLEAIAQALFKSWFVDFDPVRAKLEGRAPEDMDEATAALFPDGFEESELGMVPRGWRLGTLASLVRLHKGSLNPGNQPDVQFQHFSLPAFDAGQMPVFESGSAIKSNKTTVPESAVLLSKLNPHIPRVWLPSLVMERAVCSTEFLPFVPAGPATTAFVYCLLVAPDFCASLSQLVTGTSNSHQRVKPEGLLSLPTLVPPEGVITVFDAVANGLLSKLKANRQQARTLTDLRDTLLPRLISGQLRLPEAEALAA